MEKRESCLITTSYDGKLRLWKDLDKDPTIALECKLDSMTPSSFVTALKVSALKKFQPKIMDTFRQIVTSFSTLHFHLDINAKIRF